MTELEGPSGPRGVQSGALPPLAAEDHRCEDCGLSYPDITVERAITSIRGIPAAAREVVLAVPPSRRRERPEPGTWSVMEYLCHVRDVYVTFTIRLHRARTEEGPSLEPMFNDLRARRFRYNELDASPVLDELVLTAAGFCDQVARTQGRDWGRVVTRLPGERRTALWLVRQAMHEGVHHVEDMRRVGSAATAPRRG